MRREHHIPDCEAIVLEPRLGVSARQLADEAAALEEAFFWRPTRGGR